MSEKISDQLREEFGFTGVLGGPEYDKFPEWKKKVADNILELGMSYRIAKFNLVTATDLSDQYNRQVRKYLNGTISSMPLWAKPGSVKDLLLMFEMLRAEIKRAIRIYAEG